MISCTNEKKTPVVAADRESLEKISWIEGNWEGLYLGKPFYEIYNIINDSTLMVTSYEWNGKDSSGTSLSYLKWIDNNYYLGDSLNWKVSSITDTSIYMEPLKAVNTILWKKVDQDNWDAILKTNKGEIIYNMKRIDHFQD